VQVLVAERDILSGEIGARGGQAVLAVESFLSGELGAFDHEPARRGQAQPSAE
jgi:hypothetical protein